MTDTYETDLASGERWRLMLGDSCERLSEIEDDSIDLAVFSPPFADLFVYSPSDRDLGNNRPDEFLEHYGFIVRELLRVVKPGRICAVHCQQIVTQKGRDGFIGIRDFRGDLIRAHQQAGFIFHGEVTVDKDPQAQAIRTHAHGLLFVTLSRDSSKSRPALADYVLFFRVPGENATPVKPEGVSNETWIEWARPIWVGIRESATLNAAVARENEDERHICPLQLPLIERVVKLYTNRDETVLSPFAGIGSEGVVSVEQGRQFVGCELKRSYWETAVKNLERAEYDAHLPSLFDGGSAA